MGEACHALGRRPGRTLMSMAVRAERGPTALSPLRVVSLGVGFVCALAATVTIFLTDNAQYLRIGILIALWGFVFAALAAGRRQTEQALVASTEVELRKSYELELEREVAARREYELRLEAQLRRELQDDFGTQVGGLREEMVRLRRELSEQWDSELRVERMVMRTQSVRMGNDRLESLEHGAASLGGPASIDAAPMTSVTPNPAPASTASFEPGTFEAAAAEPAPWDSMASVADSRSSGPAAIPDQNFDEGPGTREFPVVFSAARPLPTAPVPRTPPTSSVVSPPKPPAAAVPSPQTADSDDVLTRVLAEAGATAAGRRRKHRYADEEEDAPATF